MDVESRGRVGAPDRAGWAGHSHRGPGRGLLSACCHHRLRPCPRIYSATLYPTSIRSCSMKVLYPASHDIPSLPDSHLALKISRHSRCSACPTCSGLHPPPGWRVLSDAYDGSDSDDDGEPPTKYLDRCECGHGVMTHGADMSTIGHDEFTRRGRVAVRLDELLEVSAHTLSV